MDHKSRFLKLALVLSACLLVVCVLLAAGYKALSLYSSLSRKMDYANDLIYEANEGIRDLRYTVNCELQRFTFDYDWAEQLPPFIAHALGGIDGNTYTNSLEAFEQSYASGYRIFEIDLSFPDTGYTLIACHDRDQWIEKANADTDAVFSYENFMSSALCGQYTPLDYRDVIDLMAAYPDVYIVTDTKYMDKVSILLQFSQLVRYAQSVDESVLSRLIPQIYNENMLIPVMSVYPFSSVIYTLYQSGSTLDEAIDFCGKSGIRFLTMPDYWLNDQNCSTLSRHPELITAVHTVNDAQAAQGLFELGIDLLYTDFLSPESCGFSKR